MLNYQRVFVYQCLPSCESCASLSDLFCICVYWSLLKVGDGSHTSTWVLWHGLKVTEKHVDDTNTHVHTHTSPIPRNRREYLSVLIKDIPGTYGPMDTGSWPISCGKWLWTSRLNGFLLILETKKQIHSEYLWISYYIILLNIFE
jgi:hypothetical protein